MIDYVSPETNERIEMRDFAEQIWRIGISASDIFLNVEIHEMMGAAPRS
jgi:hypothetical protein